MAARPAGLTSQVGERIPELLDFIAALVGGDYDARGRVSDELEDLDAAFAGLNMLADILATKQREVDDALELYHRAPVLLCTVSLPRGTLLSVNRTMASALGQSPEELEHRALASICSDEAQRDRLEAAFAQMAELGPVRDLDVEVRLPDGTVRQWSMQGVGAQDQRGTVGRCSFLDVSVHRRVEADLRESQRLEAVGRLAGGVAHDFNNLLTSVYGHVSFAKMAIEDGEDATEDLAAIERGAESAAELTQQLLAFARRQVVHPELVRVDDVVRRVEALLRRTFPEQIIFDVQLGDSDWVTRIDPGRLEQVLVNMCINARDAMPEGGRLTIETTTTTVGPEMADDHPEVEPGEYVLLVISDDGEGMAEETRHRIFEPYFTTKGHAGTGLGLATSHGIVAQAGGHIWVYSEPGLGTTFKLHLPRAHGAVPVAAVEVPPTVTGGNETVLLVEDEAAVRDILLRTLDSAGYRALSARDGQEALELAWERSDIDLIITDVVMPNLSGPQLIAELRRTNPKLRALYISGYTENTIVHHGVPKEGIELLSKPFVPGDLLARVRAMLDED